MNRVWVVDDAIPAQEFFGSVAAPACCPRELVQLLLARIESAAWSEQPVRELCATLVQGEFDVSCLTSPGAVASELRRDGTPPHVVILDWEGPGFDATRNVALVEQLLTSSPALVQVYSHNPPATIEPSLEDLRRRFPVRLLPVRSKAEVTPTELKEQVGRAWKGTLGGRIADNVRRDVRGAVERSLVELSEIPKEEVNAIAGRDREALQSLVFSMVRDEVRARSSESWDEVIRASEGNVSSSTIRRLVSIAYYFFPADQRMRRGDLVELAEDPEPGRLWMVLSPSCDLERIKRKAGSRVLLVQALPLNERSLASLRSVGCEFGPVGGSILASCEKSGDIFIPLPNVPAITGRRTELQDYILLSYGWESRIVNVPERSTWPVYDPAILSSFKRRCCVSDDVLEPLVGKLANIVFSPGVGDLPVGERRRLSTMLAPPKPAIPERPKN